MSVHILSFLCVSLLAAFSHAALIQPITRTPLRPFSVNQDYTTDYSFSMYIPSAIPAQAFIEVEFPLPYQLASACKAHLQGPQGTWAVYPCSKTTPSKYMVNVSQIVQGEYSLVFENIKNPAAYPASSNFQIRTYYNQAVLVDYNEYFDAIPFLPTPAFSNNASIQTMGYTSVSLGSRYDFTFSLTKGIKKGDSIKFNFADGFYFIKPACFHKNSGSYATGTETLYNNRYVICQAFEHDMPANATQIVSIIGVQNPDHAGFFLGFTLETMEGVSPNIIERVTVPGPVQVTPGDILVTIESQSLLLSVNTTHQFDLTFANDVPVTGQVWVKFPAGFRYLAPNCSLLRPLQAAPNSNISCGLAPNNTGYILEGFNGISASQRVSILYTVENPSVSTVYTEQVYSYSTQYQAKIDEAFPNITLVNQFGSSRYFAAHALLWTRRLNYNETGPLEFTFFLNIPLPATTSTFDGMIVIDIRPLVPYPPVGTLRCFFFNTIPADCSWDDTTDPNKTTITIFTPATSSYFQTEIPITITTETDQGTFGVKLDELIKRYKFYVYFYRNGELPPLGFHEVYYADYVPDPITMPDDWYTATWTPLQYGEESYLQISFTNNYLALSTNYFIELDFYHTNNAWDFNLGWPALQWYEKHDMPCFAEGLGDSVRCWLIPGGAAGTTSTIQMIGLSEIAFGTTFVLHFPKIKFGTANTATMTFTLYENTPGENTLKIPIITRDMTFQPSPARTLPSGPFPILNINPNKPDIDTTLTMGFTSTPDPTAIIYQYPDLFNLTTGVGSCGGSNVCYYFSDPVNWIVFEPNPTQGTQASTSLTIHSPPYSGPFDFSARTVLNGIVQDKVAGTLTVQPGPLTVTLATDPSVTEVNSNSNILFDVGVTTATALPVNASIQFDFTQLTVPQRDDFYCQVTGLTGMDARNVICERISATRIRLYNLQAVPVGTAISLVFQLTTNTVNAVGVTVNTYYNRTAVNQVDTGRATSTLTFRYNNFVSAVIQNDRAGDIIRAGQTGIISFKVTPGASFGATSLVVTFNTGFGVSAATDILNCTVNSRRRRCTFTQNPLTVTIPTLAGSLTAGTVTNVTISTDFSQPLTKGILAPTAPGWHPINIAIGTANPPTQQISDYVYVYPASTPSLAITAVPLTAGEFAMYTFTVTNKIALNSNLNTVTKGRMFIDFPTGTEGFANDLGTGLQTGQYVGCNIQGLATVANIHCRLASSGGNGVPVSVEVIGFGATAANTAFTIRVARIRNPTVALGEYVIAFRTDQYTIATGVSTPLEYAQYSLWQPVTAPGNIPSYNAPTAANFPGASAGGEVGVTMTSTIYAGRAMATGDYYVYALPGGVTPSVTLTCPASASNCWAFPDSGWVVYQLNRNLAGGNAVDGSVRTVTLPNQLSNNGYSFIAYAWVSNELDHTVNFDINPVNNPTPTMAGNNLQITVNGGVATVTFVTDYVIPANGEIQIVFPAGFTLNGGCNPNIVDPQGLITPNCAAQGNTWVLNNFPNNLGSGRTIRLTGQVTLPAAAGYYPIMAYTYTDGGNTRLEFGETTLNIGMGTPRNPVGNPTTASVVATRIGVIPNVQSVNLYQISYTTPDATQMVPGTYFIIRVPAGLQVIPGKTEYMTITGMRDRTDLTRSVNGVLTATGDILVSGYAAFDSSRDGALTVQVFLRNTVVGAYIFSIDVFNAANTLVATTNAAPITVAASPGSFAGGVFGPYLTDSLDVYSTQNYMLKINVGMRTALTAAGTGQFVITLPAGFTVTNGQQICKYSRDNGAHWIRSACTVPAAGTPVTMPLTAGFADLQAGDTCNIIITTNNPDYTLAGIVRPASGTVSTFNVKSQQGATVRESVFIPLVVNPLPATVTANWFNRYWTDASIISMVFTPDQALLAADYFQVEFVTNDQIEQVFPDALGQTPVEQRILGNCAQDPRSTLLSNNVNLDCYTVPGSGTSTPMIMAKTVILNTKAIVTATNLRVFLAGIQNPRNNIPGGYVFSVMRVCRNDGYGCPILRRRYYTQFLQGRTVNPISMPVPTLAAGQNPLFTLAVPTTFTLDLNPQVGATDAIVFKTDNENIDLQSPCAVTAPAGICIAFPGLKWTFYEPNAAIAAGQRSITVSMDNGLFYDRDHLLDFTAETWVSGRVAQVFTSYHPDYQVMVPALLNNATQAAFDIQRIVRNYDNILKLSMDNIWRTDMVRRIIVNIPTSYAAIEDGYCMAGCNLDDISSPDYHLFACNKTGNYQMELIIDDDWQPEYENYTVVVYYRGFLPVNASWGWQNNSTITSFASINVTQNWVVDENTGYTFYVDPVPTPIIRDVNLNLKSFNDRIARISDYVEFYGAIWPYTPFDPNNNATRITQVLFQIDNEFGYPSVSSLVCTMTVIYKVPVNCTLKRTQGKTEVLYEMPADYQHGPFLFDISNTAENLLFKAPDHEGAFQFNMTLMNSTGGTVEQANTDVDINGDYVANFTAQPILIDPLVQTLWDIEFTTTARVVPQGFAEPGQSVSTQIVLLFQTYDPAFPIDLGSGLTNGSEISCVPVVGITITKTGALTCTLIYGDFINPTQIIITGYDAIPAVSNVTIYVDDIATLGFNITSRVKLEIRSIYADTPGYFIFYNSLEVSPTAPTQPISNAPTTLQITRTGSNTIRETGSYEFDFTTTTALTENQDYFIIAFPQYGYEQQADYSNVLITITSPTGVSCVGYVMPLRNVIYVKPTAPLPAGAVTIKIDNLPNPSFALSGPQTYTVSTDVNRKIVDIFTTSLTLESSVCQLFNNVQINASSKFARINENTYQVSFTVMHQVPEAGSVAVIFDPTLYNLRPSSPQCQLVSGFPSTATCSFELFSEQLVRVSMNGVALASNTTVALNIINVNNPIDSSVAPVITIESYFDASFDSTKTICSKNVTLPAFISVNMVSCPMQIQPEINNAGQITDYLISLSCSTSMRNATLIDIDFPSAFQGSFPSDLSCSTNGNYMLQPCSLIARTTRVTVLITKPDIQSALVIRVKGIKNPTLPGNYGPFVIQMLQYEIAYGSLDPARSTATVSIISNENSVIAPNLLTLSVFPKNYGETATYYFDLVSLQPKSTPTNLLINFDKIFSRDLGASIECGTFTPQTQFGDNYALNNQYLQDLTILPCSVTGDQTLNIQLSPIINLDPTKVQDLFFYVANVVNPSLTQQTISTSSYSFNFTFMTDQRSLLFSQNSVPISFALPPSLLEITNINTTDTNMLSPASYTINLTAKTNYPLASYSSSSNYEIQLALPADDYPSLGSDSAINYTFPGNPQVEATSSAFRSENLIYFSANYLDFVTSGPFQIALNGMTNPSALSQCGLNAAGLPVKFETQYVNREEGFVFGRTYNVMDQGNCLTVDKARSAIKVVAPLYLRQGLVYTFTLQLEEPGADLSLTPISNFLVFEPSTISFKDYETKTADFQVYVSKFVPQGQYTIQWRKDEDSQYTRYLNVQDTTVIVVAENAPITLAPLPSIQVDTFRYVWTGRMPREVKITLSQEPTEEISIQVGLKVQDTKLQGSLDGIAYTNFPISVTFGPGEKMNMFFIFADDGTRDNQLTYTLSGNNANSFNPIIPNNPFMVRKTQGGNAFQIMSITSTTITENYATYIASISDVGTLFYMAVIKSSVSPTLTNLVLGKLPGVDSQYYQAGSLQIEKIQDGSSLSAFVNFTGLSAQTQYQLYFVARSIYGDYTPIQTVNLQTRRISDGVTVVIPALGTIDPTELVEALSIILSLAKSRIVFSGSEIFPEDLSNGTSPYLGDQLNQYRITIAPDAYNDSPTPLQIAQSLLTNEKQTQLLAFIPQFYQQASMRIVPVRRGSPRWIVTPDIGSQSYYTIGVSMELVDSGKLYAIMTPKTADGDIKPTSYQIANGLTADNVRVSDNFWQRVESDSNGYVQLVFDDLKDNVEYNIYITAGNDLPYEPTDLIDDGSTYQLTVTTLKNPNVGTMAEAIAIYDNFYNDILGKNIFGTTNNNNNNDILGAQNSGNRLSSIYGALLILLATILYA